MAPACHQVFDRRARDLSRQVVAGVPQVVDVQPGTPMGAVASLQRTSPLKVLRRYGPPFAPVNTNASSAGPTNSPRWAAIRGSNAAAVRHPVAGSGLRRPEQESARRHLRI